MSQRGFGSSSSRFIGDTSVPSKKGGTVTSSSSSRSRPATTGSLSFGSSSSSSTDRSGGRSLSRSTVTNTTNQRSLSRSRSTSRHTYEDDDHAYNSDSSYTNDERRNPYPSNGAQRSTTVTDPKNQRSVSVSRSHSNSKDSYGNGNNRDKQHTINNGIRSISRNRSLSQADYDNHLKSSSTSKPQRMSTTTTHPSRHRSTSSQISNGSNSTNTKASSVVINKEDKLWGDIAALTSKLARIQRGDGSNPSSLSVVPQPQSAATLPNSTLTTILTELTKLQQHRQKNDGRNNEQLSQDTLHIIAKAAAALSLQNSSHSHLNNSNPSSSRLSLSNLQTSTDTTNNAIHNNFFNDDNTDDDDISDASEEEGAGEAGMAAAVAELTKAEVARQLAAIGLGNTVSSSSSSSSSSNPSSSSYASSFLQNTSTHATTNPYFTSQSFVNPTSTTNTGNGRLPSTSMLVHPPITAAYPLALPINPSMNNNTSTYTLFPNVNANFNLSQLPNYTSNVMMNPISTTTTNPNTYGPDTSVLFHNHTATVTPRPILITANNPTVNGNGFGSSSPTKLGSIVQADFSMTDNSTVTDISSDFDDEDSDDDDDDDTSPNSNGQLSTNMLRMNHPNSSSANSSFIAQQRLLQMTLNKGAVTLPNENIHQTTSSPSKVPNGGGAGGTVKRRTIQSPSSPLSPVSSNNHNGSNSRSPGRKSVTFADEQATNQPITAVASTTVGTDTFSNPSTTNNSSLGSTPSVPQVIVVTQPPPVPTATTTLADPLVSSLKTEMDTMRNLLESLMTEVVTQKVLLQQKEKHQQQNSNEHKPNNNSPARTPTNGSSTKDPLLTEDSTMLKSLATLLSRLIKQDESVTNPNSQSTSQSVTTTTTTTARTPVTAKTSTPTSVSSSATKSRSVASLSPHVLELGSPQVEQNSPDSVSRIHRTKVSPTNSKTGTSTVLKSKATTGTAPARRKTVSYQEDVPVSSPSPSAAKSSSKPSLALSTPYPSANERRALHPRNVKGRVGIAICDFEGDIAENQMSLIENERILITHEFETGWWYGYRLLTVPSTIDTEKAPGYARTSGYIPASFMDMTDEVYDSEDSTVETANGTIEPVNNSVSVRKGKSLSTPYTHANRPSTVYSDADEEEEDDDENDQGTTDNDGTDNVPIPPLTSTRSGRLTAHKAAAARARLSLSLGGKTNPSAALDLNEIMLASPPANPRNSNGPSTVTRVQPVYNVPTPSILRASSRKIGAATSFTSPGYGNRKGSVETDEEFSNQDFAASTNNRHYQSHTTTGNPSLISTAIKTDSNDWQTLKEAYNQLRTKAVAMEASFNSTWGSSSSSSSSSYALSGLRSPLTSSLSTASSSSFLHNQYTTLRPQTATAMNTSTVSSMYPREMHTTRKPTLSSVIGASFTDRAHSLATPARTPYYTASVVPSTRPGISVGPAFNGTIASLFFPPRIAQKDMATSPMPTTNDDHRNEEEYRPTTKKLSPMRTEPRGTKETKLPPPPSIPAPPASPVPTLPSAKNFHPNGTITNRTPHVMHQDEGVSTDDLMDSPAPPPPPQSLPSVSPPVTMMMNYPKNTTSEETTVRTTNAVTQPPIETTATINIADSDDDDDDDDDIPPPPPPLPEPTKALTQTSSAVLPHVVPLQPHPPTYTRGTHRAEMGNGTVPTGTVLQPPFSSQPTTVPKYNDVPSRRRSSTTNVPVTRSIAIESPSPPKQSPIQPRTVHSSPEPLVPQSTASLSLPSTVPMVTHVPPATVIPAAVTIPQPTVPSSIISSYPPVTMTATAANRPLLRPYSMQNITTNNNGTNNLNLAKPQDTPNTVPPMMMTSSVPSSSSSLNLPVPSSLPNTNTGFVVKPFLSMNSNPAPGITGPGSKQPKPMVGRTAINSSSTILSQGNNDTYSPPSPPLGSSSTAQVPNSVPVLPSPPANPGIVTNIPVTLPPSVPSNPPVTNTFSSPPPPPPPSSSVVPAPETVVTSIIPSSSSVSASNLSPVPPPPATDSSVAYYTYPNTLASSSPLANLIASTTTAFSSPLRIGGPLPNSALPIPSLTRGSSNRYSPENNSNRKAMMTTSPVLYNGNGSNLRSSPPTFVRSPSQTTTTAVTTNATSVATVLPASSLLLRKDTMTRPPPPRMDPRLRLAQTISGPTRIE